MLFSIVAAPIYIPKNSVVGLPFLHILISTYFNLIFFFFGHAMLHADLSSLIRNQTHAPCSGSMESYPLIAREILVIVCCVFDDSLSDRCEAISLCGFDLHFPDA